MILFVVIHIVKVFNMVNEVIVFLKFPCTFYDPMDVGNLISGSSAFSKSSLYIWKFSVYLLLKTSLKDFEHNHTTMWNEWNCTVIWRFFGIAFLWDWKENWPFPVPWLLLSFPICWHTDYSTLTASSFEIQNNSPGIPSLPLALLLALFIETLLKTHWTSHSRMSGSRWVTTPSWELFCTVLLSILAIYS